MTATLIYWLDVDGDRTGLEVRINGIPGERLLGCHGLNFPVNEYLLTGTNTFEVRPGAFASNGGLEDSGKIAVRLKRLTGQGAVSNGEEVLFDQTVEFERIVPGQPLVTGAFDHPGAPMLDLADFDPPAPQHAAAILDELGRVARIWQNGDGEGAALWMYRYVQDYCAAYPLETAGTMKAAIDRMASFLSSGRVLFDPARVRFEPVAGGRLVDCTSPEGAAVRVALPDGAVYDMWTVFGVQGGHPTLVR